MITFSSTKRAKRLTVAGLPKVAVVLLNWNGRALLEQYLPSVVENTPSYAELIVADNGSADDSLSFLKSSYPQIRIIKNEYNAGYAAGYNLALEQIDADYYVLLNTDVEVSPNWLDPLITLMESDEHIAACQPKIRSHKHRELFEYAGAGGGLIDYLGYPFCRGRLFNSLEEDQGQFDDTTEIFWATGACLFVRASVFHQAGGFDADFFAHMEEIDLCWRLKLMGHKVMYCGQSTVYHLGGGTLPKNNSRKTYLNFRNNLILLQKNLPALKFYWVLLLRLLLDGTAGFKFLLLDSPMDCFAVIRAHLVFYSRFPQNLNKRRQVKRLTSSPNLTGIHSKSIVWQYFFSGKRKWNEL